MISKYFYVRDFQLELEYSMADDGKAEILKIYDEYSKVVELCAGARFAIVSTKDGAQGVNVFLRLRKYHFWHMIEIRKLK